MLGSSAANAIPVAPEPSSLKSKSALGNPRPKPAQEKLQNDINVHNDILNGLYGKRKVRSLTASEMTELKSEETILKKLKQDLKSKQDGVNRMAMYRKKHKQKMQQLDPETKKFLTGKSDFTPGRPPKNDESSLMAAIIDIVMPNSAAENRRRSDLIRATRSLEDLTNALKIQGFDLERSTVYLRLIPRNIRSIEGKRHYKTAQVKLIRPSNSAHSEHPATKFARSSINHLEEVAGFLGPEQCTFHSQDDKAKVPIGITAANKQTPLLMHMEYRIRLPDHDFVVAANHKLIPSVIGDMQIKSDCMSKEAVSYSGPTYIGIRSSKHSGSSAFHHLQDMKRIRTLDSFKDSFHNSKGEQKPVMIVTVDGGPDECPRLLSLIISYYDLHSSQFCLLLID